jgi:hypothetical protein
MDINLSHRSYDLVVSHTDLDLLHVRSGVTGWRSDDCWTSRYISRQLHFFFTLFIKFLLITGCMLWVFFRCVVSLIATTF